MIDAPYRLDTSSPGSAMPPSAAALDELERAALAFVRAAFAVMRDRAGDVTHSPAAAAPSDDSAQAPCLHMTAAQYAAHRDCSDSLVRRYRRAGRLVECAHGLIAAQASDDALRRSMSTRGGRRTPAARSDGPNEARRD